MCKGYGLQGRGETPESVVETGGSAETSEGHVRIYFGGREGVAATGTRQAWRGRGRVGGVGFGK